MYDTLCLMLIVIGFGLGYMANALLHMYHPPCDLAQQCSQMDVSISEGGE